jgi:hypothetical protein
MRGAWTDYLNPITEKIVGVFVFQKLFAIRLTG